MDDGFGYVIYICRINIHIWFSSKYEHSTRNANNIKAFKWNWKELYISIEIEKMANNYFTWNLDCFIRWHPNAGFEIWSQRILKKTQFDNKKHPTPMKNIHFTVFTLHIPNNLRKWKIRKTQSSKNLRNLCLLWHKQSEAGYSNFDAIPPSMLKSKREMRNVSMKFLLCRMNCNGL